jgi:DNA invertase Pin-like site-specific DNA recombinase
MKSLQLGRWLDSDEHVHHVDGDVDNNHPDNLEVMKPGEHHRLHNRENPPVAILDKDKVLRIKGLLDKGIKQRTIACLFGIHQVTVSAIATGKSWGHVTGIVENPNPKRQLTIVEAKEIRELLKKGRKPKDICKLYGINKRTVSDIRLGRTHKE